VQHDLQFYHHHHTSDLYPGIIRCLFTGLHSYQHNALPLCIRREFYQQGNDTGQHLHEDFYALYIVQEGKGIHMINRHPYGISCGDVYVLPPGTVHAYHNYHTLTIDAFYFSPQLFSHKELLALRSLSGFWELLITIGTARAGETPAQTELVDHHLHLSPEKHREVKAMIAELRSEFIASSLEANVLTHSQFFRLLVHLARWQATGKTNQSTQTTAQKIEIATILHFCDEHFHEPISVPQLAALICLSPSRFSELFSREVGMAPAAYIRHLRLERAQMLLRTTALSTTAIAHQVGLSDSAQLSRVFRAAFQLTPSTYRHQFRRSDLPSTTGL